MVRGVAKLLRGWLCVRLPAHLDETDIAYRSDMSVSLLSTR
jgi:hypothetical protein